MFFLREIDYKPVILNYLLVLSVLLEKQNPCFSFKLTRFDLKRQREIDLLRIIKKKITKAGPLPWLRPVNISIKIQMQSSFHVLF